MASVILEAGLTRNQKLVDLLLQRCAHDERRGDLYQRLAALQDAQRRHFEKMTAHVQARYFRVVERIQLLQQEETEGVKYRSAVNPPYVSQEVAGIACAEQRLRDTLRQTQRMNTVLQAALEETSAQCERLQQWVRTRAAHDSLAATEWSPISAATATGHPSGAPQSCPCEGASPSHKLAVLARHTASSYAKALSAVRQVVVDYRGLQEDIQKQLQNAAACRDPAAVMVALTALAGASDNLLLSYTQFREEQRAHHLALLRTVGLLLERPA